jgi:DnaJ-class molecular chaperone
MENLYYEYLGVSKDSEYDEIRKAYFYLALKWHPDKNLFGKKRAEKVFVEINEAFVVLSDHEIRNVYDVSGLDAARSMCVQYNLSDFSLANAYEVFNSAYKTLDTVPACLEDGDWYKNSDLLINSPLKAKIAEKFKENKASTEVIETFTSKYITSPKKLEKSSKTIIFEKNGRRVKKTTTTITRPDGSQEIIEEEKEEQLLNL